MIRSEFFTRARLLLQQGGFSDLLQSDPFTEQFALDSAADDVCKGTDCFWREFKTDLIADQSEYCDPFIYNIKAIYIIDDAGDQRPLSLFSTRDMNSLYPIWRQWVTDLNPRYAMAQAMNRFVIAPTPSTNRDDALIFTGFAVTCDSSTAQAFHLWPDDTDECPIPQEGHDAVLYRYIWLRLLQMMAEPKTAPIAAALMPTYERLYEEQKGRLETFAQIRYSQMQQGFPAYNGY